MQREAEFEVQAIGEQLRRLREWVEVIRGVDTRTLGELLAAAAEVLRLLKQLTDRSPHLIAQLEGLAAPVRMQVVTADDEADDANVDAQVTEWFELARLCARRFACNKWPACSICRWRRERGGSSPWNCRSWTSRGRSA